MRLIPITCIDLALIQESLSNELYLVLILIGPNSSSYGIEYAAADMCELEGGTRQKKAWQFKRSSETGTGFICLDETTTCCNIHGVYEDDNK
ncbi:hypothetical protein ISN45_Aa06g010500 [Arabidopsis thaliana x Arabidopsis arenosa]|uniref:Uncharacterized protein n=1 Tax=Arabidopsis thaliana x Arabidopsis arenosa TaxID=1240361 RepID=A0A8T1YUT3_9BRAS|nr:hypothetical protein ISN45_Aa06g010500 [Arabidopsis thaliana x Arabidopsis arenosa]